MGVNNFDQSINKKKGTTGLEELHFKPRLFEKGY